MPKSYVKHDREVTTEQLQRYGKLATHDIHVPILLLYPIGTISDKNGTPVAIDDDFIKTTMKATNSSIKKRFDSPFAKVKSFYANTIGDYEIIPIIKNHKTDDVDNLVGHTKGLTYLDKIDGVSCLCIMGVIKDPETKSKMEGDLFRNTSLGTRGDGSIKEISIVSNEALAHGGFLMGEEDTTPTKIEESKASDLVSKKELKLSEEITALQLEEQTLDNITIPNHIVLSKMIKTCRIEPWQYDDLISESPATLKLMERTMPALKLGIIYGTNREPQKIDTSDALIEHIIGKHNKRTGKVNKKQLSQAPIEAIKQDHSFEEVRHKELTYILELAEYSPEIAKKYISAELGEDVAQPEYNDKYLIEYLNKSREVKTKLKNLQIQLGEFKND